VSPPLYDRLEQLKSETLKIVEFILAQQRIISPFLLPPVRVIVTQILSIGQELNAAQAIEYEVLQILHLEDLFFFIHHFFYPSPTWANRTISTKKRSIIR
jgi:hypothetical protein